ncbi:MAG TPA: beta-glucuronidase [Sphingomonas sp.]
MADTPHQAGDMTRRQVFETCAGVAAGAALVGRAGAAAPALLAAETPRFTPLYPHESATRTARDLSGLWDFRLDPEDQGEARRWFEGFDQARRIPVPCSWNDLFDDAENYFGAAWYQTEFRADAPARDRRLLLRFGSAVYRAKVWLNGRLLGEHLGGHLPFAFDATDAVRGDGPNRLVVMVENRLQIDRVPAVPDTGAFHLYQEDLPETSYDFFPYSGLHRPVWLCSVPATHLRDVTVTTRREGASGLVDVEVSVAGRWSGPARLTLTGGAGPIDVPLSVSGGTGTATIRVAAPRLWRPADPFLYTLTVRLGAGAPIDEYALPIGLRTIEVQGEALLLNGEPVHLRGFGKHEDFFLHGRGQDLAVLVRDFELLKWIGANSFRTSHYPYSEEAMMLADRYGFLVIGETPAVSLTFADAPAAIAARHRQLTEDITDLVSRDKNHPCVILWSIANEPLPKPFHSIEAPPPDAVAKGKAFFADMFAHLRAIDRTRPVSLVSVHNGPVEWVSQGDVICTNSYNGWYAVSGRIPDAAATLDREIRALRARCGAKPIIVTEFGADAMAGIHAQPPEMWSEDFQSDLIATYLDVLAKLPFVVGTHPWAFADFKTSQNIMRVGSLNLKGVFTRDRRPKEAARMLRARWTAAT